MNKHKKIRCELNFAKKFETSINHISRWIWDLKSFETGPRQQVSFKDIQKSKLPTDPEVLGEGLGQIEFWSKFPNILTYFLMTANLLSTISNFLMMCSKLCWWVLVFLSMIEPSRTLNLVVKSSVDFCIWVSILSNFGFNSRTVEGTEDVNCFKSSIVFKISVKSKFPAKLSPNFSKSFLKISGCFLSNFWMELKDFFLLWFFSISFLKS